jgi:nitroimidazol reductase NimA-like FMN-containing flavoprotein (pyridoxamine 5'-phosphate oxidase superfamily)
MKTNSRIEVSRLAKRASYDPALINAILDESVFCFVSYSVDNQPFIIPTGYCRINDQLYIHGSVGSHFLRELAKGVEVCVAVALLDGLVLARSAFHHSVNYRSVVVFGKTRLVEDEDERWLALEKFTEHIIPGRWAEIRQPNASEMKKTMVIAIPITEASAKTRDGQVGDDEEDYQLDIWAGVLPMQMTPQMPIADPLLKPNLTVPAHVKNYNRKK